jgi:hypothetical protein
MKKMMVASYHGGRGERIEGDILHYQYGRRTTLTKNQCFVLTVS